MSELNHESVSLGIVAKSLDNLDDTVKRVERKMDETFLDIKHRLFGNGRPGLLNEYDERIDSLESSRDQWRGARWILGILAAIIGGGVSALMEYLFHHH